MLLASLLFIVAICILAGQTEFATPYLKLVVFASHTIFLLIQIILSKRLNCIKRDMVYLLSMVKAI